MLAMRGRGVRDTAILRAMERVPRERFAPAHLRHHARRDIALPLPCGQTMTAPTTIAAMLAALALRPGHRVFEIGTGSGYVTALLASLGAGEIRSVERYATLAEDARDRLAAEGCGAEVTTADGLGEVAGRYDRILVNGTLTGLPPRLAEALMPGGRLVGVVGRPETGRLVTAERGPDGALAHRLGPKLRLAPMTPGRAAVL